MIRPLLPLLALIALFGCSLPLAGPGGGESWYAAEIAPILGESCVSCHGETKAKGGLRLHTPDAIAAGGSGGSIFVADDPLSMRTRILSPEDDLDHMPPEGKPQLSAAARAALVAWIDAGASFTAAAPGRGAVAQGRRSQSKPAPALEPEARDALHAAHVHVEVIDPDQGLLYIDAGAVAALPTEQLIDLIAPAAASVGELSLRGVPEAGRILAKAGPWPRLQVLDLTRAGVDRKGLNAAARGGGLEELLLIGATLDEKALEKVCAIDSLREVHLWGVELPEEVASSLAERADLIVNRGEVTPPPAVEVEAEFVFGKPPVETKLPAVNAVCPVSGTPVDPAFRIVHGDEVIGFCCPNCPKTFWNDPAAHPVERIAAE